MVGRRRLLKIHGLNEKVVGEGRKEKVAGDGWKEKVAEDTWFEGDSCWRW